MPTEAVVTLIITGLIVVALAIALLRVIVELRYISYTLGSVTAVVNAIARQTRPVPGVIQSVNRTLQPVRSRAENLG